MAPPPTPKHEIVDGFLPESLNRRLLSFAIGHESDFIPSTVQGESTKIELRNSLRFDADITAVESDFSRHMDNALDEIFGKLGIPAFKPSHYEIELIAHGDRAFYRPHIDTFTRQQRSSVESDRVISCVYYFHSLPKGFEGGHLALFRIGEGAPYCSIQPSNNRLVAFPSFVMHEVQLIECHGCGFDKSRFAINCWIHRKI